MNRQSGQAIIEYLLVLVIAILIILGIMYKFNSSFRVYVDSFFGNYVACLLETGELPALGSGSQGYCSQNFNAQFDPNAGTNGNPNVGNGGGGGGVTANNLQPQSPQNSSGSSGQPSSSSSSGGGSAQGADGGGSGGGGPKSASSFFNSKGRPSKTVVGEVDKESGVSYTGSSAPLRTNKAVGEVAGDSGRVTRMALDRRFFSDQERADKTATPLKDTSAAGEEGESLRPKKTQYDVKRASAKMAESEEEGFSLGKLLRFLLIFVILGTLVLLIGGQMLQISKSWEK